MASGRLIDVLQAGRLIYFALYERKGFIRRDSGEDR